MDFADAMRKLESAPGRSRDEVSALADGIIALATRPQPLDDPADEAMAERLVAAFTTWIRQLASALVEFWREYGPAIDAILSVRRARMRAARCEYARRQRARRRR